jgi:glycosyltransferase involved in cell wall biosynthesis
MPKTEQVRPRIWFGLARRTANGISLEGALRPWDGTHDFAQVLVLDDQGPTVWLRLKPDEVSKKGVLAHIGPGRPTEISVPAMHPGFGDLCIAICTRERPESLAQCLERIRDGNHGQYEVLVIDNAPLSESTKEIVEQLRDKGMRVRRVVEKTPGLARARNAALRATDAEFVAFTDDDARPDSGWAAALHQGFAAGDEIAVVTGIVPPAEIETHAQALFDGKMKWSRNLRPEIFSSTEQRHYDWPFPYSAGHLGAGANFAVRRRIALHVGGFDEALGAGTRTEGGEDSEMFVRVIRAGYKLHYQPSAIVWHLHRRNEKDLRRLLFGYGKALSAVAVREFIQPGKLDMVRGTLQGARNLWSDRRGEFDAGMPWNHLVIEGMGVLVGPFAYAIERWLGPRMATEDSIL